MLDQSKGLSTAKGRACFAVSAVFLVLIIVVGGLRIWAKRIVGRRFQLYDYLAFGALVSAIGLNISVLLAVYPGALGMHTTDVRSHGNDELRTTLKLLFSSGFLWSTATTLIKLSLLHFYRTVFLSRTVSFARASILQYATCGIYVLVVCFWIGHILMCLLMCQPIEKNWEYSLPGHCGDMEAHEISTAAINMVLDFAIVLLPMPVLWTLQLPLKKKIVVNIIMSLGICMCIINMSRLILVCIFGESDFTYTQADVAILSGLEVYMGFICASIATLAPILHRHSLQLKARDRKEWMLRWEDRSPNMPRSSRRGFGGWLFNTTHEQLTDGDNAVRNQHTTRKTLEIERQREFSVSIQNTSGSECRQAQYVSVSAV